MPTPEQTLLSEVRVEIKKLSTVDQNIVYAYAQMFRQLVAVDGERSVLAFALVGAEMAALQ